MEAVKAAPSAPPPIRATFDETPAKNPRLAVAADTAKADRGPPPRTERISDVVNADFDAADALLVSCTLLDAFVTQNLGLGAFGDGQARGIGGGGR